MRRREKKDEKFVLSRYDRYVVGADWSRIGGAGDSETRGGPETD
jgi:hypothetical protein